MGGTAAPKRRDTRFQGAVTASDKHQEGRTLSQKAPGEAAPVKKFGFCNRIGMKEIEFAKAQAGLISKIHINNAFINSCVPHTFE